MVSAALQCSIQLDSATCILNRHSTATITASKRQQLLALALNQGSSSRNEPGQTPELTQVQKEVISASEIEQAAYAIRQAQTCCRKLQNLLIDPLNKDSSNDAHAGEKKEFMDLRKVHSELASRVLVLEDSLCKTTRSWLDEYLASISSPSASTSRSLLHCLRALCATGKCHVAQDAVEAAMLPVLKAQMLTAGKMGGVGGRGSFSGLEECLSSVLKLLISQPQFGALISAAEALDILNCSSSEEHSKSSTQLNLLVKGVWKTVIQILLDRFPDMLTVALPRTLHACYTHIAHFTSRLPDALVNTSAVSISVTAADAELTRNRLLLHPLVRELDGRWNVDLYYQMRLAEITARIDRACNDSGYASLEINNSLAATPTSTQFSGTSELSKINNVVSDHDTNIQKDIKQRGCSRRGLSDSTCLSIYALDNVSDNTLTSAQITVLCKDCGIDSSGIRLPLIKSIAIEMCTCLHLDVVLPALTGKFFQLALRLLLRLEAYVVATLDVSSKHFAAGSRILSGCTDFTGTFLVVNGANETALSNNATSVTGDVTTPVKPSPPTGYVSGGITPSLPNTANNSQAVSCISSPGPTADEVLLLASDIQALAAWVTGGFIVSVQQVVKLSAVDEVYPMNTSNAALQTLCDSRVSSLHFLQMQVLDKLQRMLSVESKSVLLGSGASVGGPVKAIASRYRMTNKPPPETASAYVEAILRSLRQFFKKNKTEMLALLTSSKSNSADRMAAPAVIWMCNVLESISSCFLVQVQALAETVRAMESTLQSRRHKLQIATAGGQTAVASGMTDSDKIALQVRIDVLAYAADVRSILSEVKEDNVVLYQNSADDMLPVLKQLLAQVEVSS